MIHWSISFAAEPQDKIANKWRAHMPLTPHRLSTPHTWNAQVESCKPELCLGSIIYNTSLDADVYTEEWH